MRRATYLVVAGRLWSPASRVAVLAAADGLVAKGNTYPSTIPISDSDAAASLELDQVPALRDEVSDRPCDIVVRGRGSAHSPAAPAGAGATWWIESMWDVVREVDAVLAADDRLLQGEPR